VSDVKAFLTNLPIWTHKNTPREFFLGAGGLIGIGFLVAILPMDIPASLFLFLGPLTVFWGLRMLYQNKDHSDFETLRVLTYATMAVALVMMAVLIAKIGDPIGPSNLPSLDIDGLHEACEQGSMGACDTLYRVTPVDSEEEWFGTTCGLRSAQPRFGNCVNSGY
jgi:hypothetical protein